jgi:hypothetical protein
METLLKLTALGAACLLLYQTRQLYLPPAPSPPLPPAEPTDEEMLKALRALHAAGAPVTPEVRRLALLFMNKHGSDQVVLDMVSNYGADDLFVVSVSAALVDQAGAPTYPQQDQQLAEFVDSLIEHEAWPAAARVMSELGLPAALAALKRARPALAASADALLAQIAACEEKAGPVATGSAVKDLQ